MPVPFTSRFLDAFPPPKFFTMSAAAIDISDSLIKYLDAQFTGAGYVPYTFDRVELEPGVVVDGIVKDHERLARSLKRLRTLYGRSFVYAALPEELAYLFTLVLPSDLSASAIRQAVEFSLGDHVPIPADELVFNFEQRLPYADSKEVHVSVVAFPISVVEGYEQALSKAGFIVRGLELEAQAVARAVVPRNTEGTSMVIDFGRNRTGITITNGAMPVFSTTVAVGGSAITETIMQHTNMSEEEADDFKRTRGITFCENEELKQALLQDIAALVKELKRHYQFWEGREEEGAYHHTKLERLYLCGGAVGLHGLPEHVEQLLQVPVTLGNVWQHMFDFDKHIPAVSNIESWQYATAAGLLMHDLT